MNFNILTIFPEIIKDYSKQSILGRAQKNNLIKINVINIRDFSEVWNNKFKFFRDPNRTKCGKCENCEWWEECLGGSMHVWDFDKNEPKMCHWDYIK